MPPKLDKSHGFMKAIVQNQVARDEYDKQERLKKNDREIENVQSISPTVPPRRDRTPKRQGIQLYVPPHAKSKATDEPMDVSPSPEPNRLSSGQKRTRKNVPSLQDENVEILFMFEYENDLGNVRQFNVNKGDNAEDLAETFGNQLGLTKIMKKALQYKLNEEINNGLNNS